MTETSPIEAKLAALDRNTTTVGARDVRPYADVLDRLAAKCPEPRERVADFAVTGVRILREKGVRWTILETLQGMDQALPSDAPSMSCAEVIAALVTITTAQ